MHLKGFGESAGRQSVETTIARDAVPTARRDMATKPMAMSLVRKSMTTIPQWKLIAGRRIRRDVKTRNFKEALRLVNVVGKEAEAYGHHPDIKIYDWNRVRLELTTHDAGWHLTKWDFAMARKLNRVLA